MTWMWLLLVLALGIILGLVTIPAMIKFGHKYRLLDMPGKHKRHKEPTPFLGGPALFITVWLTVLISYLFFPSLYSGLAGNLWYVLGGALIILLVGLSDDLSPLSAWFKLTAQVAAGYVLYLGGLRVEFLSTPTGSIEIGYFSVIITILWVVGLSNAINLIDGLDGLASGVSLIGALTVGIIGQLYQIGSILVLIYGMLGFLIVFLFYNRYPARIFLGDSGSMQIGYYFAVFSLVFPLKSYTATALYLPLLALGVPILETLTSFMRRLVSGKNIMKADRRHIFHYLSLIGFSPHQVVMIFYVLAVIFGIFALAMYFWNRLIVFGVLVVFMVVIFIVFFILLTNLFPRKRFEKTGNKSTDI